MVVTDIKALIATACEQCEYSDVKAMLNEHAPAPLWSEQVALISFLTTRVRGASFEYSHADGWTYIKEEL